MTWDDAVEAAKSAALRDDDERFRRGDSPNVGDAAVVGLRAALPHLLVSVRRYGEAQAISAKARGVDDRDWLDLLALLDRLEAEAKP